MKRGFSLVEIITILFIISLGLVGILSLLIQNIQSQGYNKNNLIAYQLAQEGVELIRKVRDSNWRTANEPLDELFTAGQYYMDYLDSEPQPYSGSPAQLVLKQDAAGFYFHDLASTATSSIFSRLIVLQNVSAASVRVIVRVSWEDRERNYAYDLETMLYNWR
ncbi:MAG: hypothetical protein WC456_00815 [Patescibacteria group bacterium]